MTNKNIKLKRLPKGQRIHLRRLKQAAAKDPTLLQTIIKRGS